MQHSHQPEILAVKGFRFQKKNLLGLKLDYCTSLVPRLSHHPVYDCLQYAKTEGEAWSILSREWCQCLPKLGRGGEEPPIERTHFAPAFEPGAARFSLCEHLKFQHLGQKLWCHSCDQDSSSVFAYCKWSKMDGVKTWERGYYWTIPKGTRPSYTTAIVLVFARGTHIPVNCYHAAVYFLWHLSN